MVATITGADFRVTPSARDAAILAARVEARDRIAGPRVGDIIRFADGGEGRFTYHWGDGIQTTTRPNGGGSFYLTESGGLSYSGSLAESVPLARIVDTGEESSVVRQGLVEEDRGAVESGVLGAVAAVCGGQGRLHTPNEGRCHCRYQQPSRKPCLAGMALMRQLKDWH